MRLLVAVLVAVALMPSSRAEACPAAEPAMFTNRMDVSVNEHSFSDTQYVT